MISPQKKYMCFPWYQTETTMFGWFSHEMLHLYTNVQKCLDGEKNIFFNGSKIRIVLMVSIGFFCVQPWKWDGDPNWQKRRGRWQVPVSRQGWHWRGCRLSGDAKKSEYCLGSIAEICLVCFWSWGYDYLRSVGCTRWNKPMIWLPSSSLEEQNIHVGGHADQTCVCPPYVVLKLLGSSTVYPCSTHV